MILSRTHGFLFIKAHKVGGTSVEMALSTICSNGDIVTPVTPVDEIKRLEMGGMPRNFSRDPQKDQEFVDALRKASPEQLAVLSPKNQRFRNHMTLKSVAKKTDIAGLRVIGIVRSPYGLVVSWANHRAGFAQYRRTGQPMRASRERIQKIVDQGIEEDKIKDKCLSPSYKNSSNQVAIEALHHERLDQDFEKFIQSLRVARQITLPRAKEGLSLTARESADLLRPDQRRVIEDAFAEDITNFGDGLDR